MIKVTILVENSVFTSQLKAEHGFAAHVQAGDKSVLFDTGQSNLVLENAAHLKVDLSTLDAIVLSHGHYDHTSGLSAILDLAPKAKVFLHPAATAPRHVRDPEETARPVGMPASAVRALGQLPQRLFRTSESTEVVPGIFATGEVPRCTDFETVEGSFFQDVAFKHPDGLPDDQALFFDTKEGTVVMLGCAHAGVVNTLKHIECLTGQRPIHAIIGGMHLVKANASRINSTIAEIQRRNIPIIAPAHCTGAKATAMFWNAFPDRIVPCATGTVLSFKDQRQW